MIPEKCDVNEVSTMIIQLNVLRDFTAHNAGRNTQELMIRKQITQ